MRGPRVCLCLILLAGVLAAQSAPARAGQPTTNALEQHWELLAETGNYSTGTGATLVLRRGALPGGTTKFDPQPSATFEIVAKHTGGNGNSKWQVDLMASSSEVLASADPFFAADSALSIKTGAISWPSADKNLWGIRLTKVHDGLNLAGTLSVQKAYVKIRQTGTIKKTVGRVPLSTRQADITNTTWQDVTETAFYKHLASSFDPAPTIRLRTSGAEVTANPLISTLHVQLVNSAGSAVTGAENAHGGFGSLTTNALSLSLATVWISLKTL